MARLAQGRTRRSNSVQISEARHDKM